MRRILALTIEVTSRITYSSFFFQETGLFYASSVGLAWA